VKFIKKKMEDHAPSGDRSVKDILEALKHLEHTKDLTSPSDSLDDEFAEGEKAALEEMKKREVCKNFSDRFIMACLYVKKFKLDQAEKIMQNNLKWRKQNNYEVIQKFSELNPKFFDSGSVFSVPGARAKNGCTVSYIIVNKMIPKEIGMKNIIDSAVWSGMHSPEIEKLDGQRNGLIIIEDLTGLSFKNIDLTMQKKINELATGNFPQLMKSILLINPSPFLKVVLKLCKLFMKKKLMDRIKVVTKEELKDYVDADVLPKHFGGNLEFGYEDTKKILKVWAEENNA